MNPSANLSNEEAQVRIYNWINNPGEVTDPNKLIGISNTTIINKTNNYPFNLLDRSYQTKNQAYVSFIADYPSKSPTNTKLARGTARLTYFPDIGWKVEIIELKPIK